MGANPTRQSLQPEAIGAVTEVTKWLKPSDTLTRSREVRVMSYGWILMVTIGIYFLPTIVAARHPNTTAILAFLGWTFIGWVIALVWVCTAVVPPN